MDAKLNIIVVEDHDVMREMTVETLQGHGHHVVGVESAEDVVEIQGRMHVDLMVVDLNLPGEDGLSLTRRLRNSHPEIGVIMLTARGALTEKMEGYESGADIYLTKPTGVDELNAAINALSRRLRRTANVNTTLKLDMLQLTLKNGEQSVDITSNEARMLEAFILAPGNRLESWQLIDVLGKADEVNGKANLEMQIARLRKKILNVSNEKNPIKSIRQLGYQLCVILQAV